MPTLEFGRALRQFGVPAAEGALALDKLLVISQNTGVGLTDLIGKTTTYGSVLKNAGFTLLGGGEVGNASGIRLLVAANVEIKNGTVRGFLGRGIFGDFDSPNVRVIGVRSVANFNSGIVVRGSASMIDGCTALKGPDGHVGVRSASTVWRYGCW